MSIGKIIRGPARVFVAAAPFVLFGCGSEGGIDPNIKVEQGKSAEASTINSPPASKAVPAPVRRTKINQG